VEMNTIIKIKSIANLTKKGEDIITKTRNQNQITNTIQILRIDSPKRSNSKKKSLTSINHKNSTKSLKDKTTMIKKNRGCKQHLLISIQMKKTKKLIKLEKIKHQMKKFSNMKDVSTIEIISIKMITGISILKKDIRKEVAIEEIEVGIVVVIEVVIEKTIIVTIEMISMKMIKMKEIM